MNKYTKTSAFLIYAAGLDPSDFPKNFENAYLDDHQYIKEDSEIDIFIVFHSPESYDEDFEMFCEVLRLADNFLDEYDIKDFVVFRLSLLKEWQHVKEELITSKYSKIDRNYVETFFPKRVYYGSDEFGRSLWKPSKNYQILTAAEELKVYWEERLDVEIPEDAEVWSKLSMEEEVFRHRKDHMVIETF